MAWPANSSNIDTTNLDSSTDSPAAARANLKTALDELVTAGMITQGERGRFLASALRAFHETQTSSAATVDGQAQSIYLPFINR